MDGVGEDALAGMGKLDEAGAELGAWDQERGDDGEGDQGSGGAGGRWSDGADRDLVEDFGAWEGGSVRGDGMVDARK